MNTKLTLSIPKKDVDFAKKIAKRRGKSVSKMVADYFAGLKRMEEESKNEEDPLIEELAGVISSGSSNIMAELFKSSKC
jgi:hypothetical protein